MTKTLAILLLGTPLLAQTPLALKDAVRLALEKHPSMEAVQNGIKAAETRIDAAKSGYLPKFNYAESYLRSNNPVVVFSSLLAQRRFTEQNFAIGELNRPDAINNFQSQVTVDQVLYDGGQTRNAIKSAELGRNLVREEERGAAMSLIANVVKTYHGVALAAENLKVADEGVRSAEADLERADAIRQAGMSTDADVLSIRVHLAAVREQQIRRGSDLDVARAALNEALGLPLSQPHELTTALTAAGFADLPLEDYEKQSLGSRPEARASRLASSLAQSQGDAARASLLPQVIVHAGFEADRARFVTHGGSNWLASASLRWNLFNGFADKARIEESSYMLRRARAQENQTDSAVRLQVRRAYAELKSAQQRIEVARAAVSMAEEGLRITKNRFEAGLGNVTDLLRTETALLESRTRHLAAVYDQCVAAVNLELAAGILSENSQVLN